MGVLSLVVHVKGKCRAIRSGMGVVHNTTYNTRCWWFCLATGLQRLWRFDVTLCPVRRHCVILPHALLTPGRQAQGGGAAGWRRARDVAGAVVSSLSRVWWRHLRSVSTMTGGARLLVCCALVVGAVSCFPGDAKAQRGWTVTLFGQQFIDDALLEILFEGDLFLERNFKDSYFVSVAVAKDVLTFGELLTIEIEGQVIKHFGLQDNWEFTAALVFRWLDFPWDKYVDTSFAFGDGVSAATEIPDVETDVVDKKDGQRFMNLVLLEFDFTLPRWPRWSFVARLHHRSGAYGLLGQGEGSNFTGFGIRYRL